MSTKLRTTNGTDVFNSFDLWDSLFSPWLEIVRLPERRNQMTGLRGSGQISGDRHLVWWSEPDGKDGVTYFVELPGVKKEDIAVELETSILRLYAERKTGNGKCSWSTAFSADGFSADSISSEFENGLLKIIMKNNEKVKTTKIAIK